MYQSLNEVQKRRLFNSVLAVTVLLAVFLGVKSLNAIKENSKIGQGIYPTNVINVTGKGEVMAIPDTGSFYFSITEEAKTVNLAQEKASKKTNTIIDALKALGIEEKDIKTTSYNSYPKYQYSNSVCPMYDSAGGVSMPRYCPPGKEVLVGYEVNQTITVKIRKTADAGSVLTKVGDLGAANISGLSFVIDDLEKVQDEARDKAIEDAKQKAKILAESLGVKLKRIVSFSENGNYPIPYGGYGMGGMELQATKDATVSSVPPELPPGENEIVSNVTITYEIE